MSVLIMFHDHPEDVTCPRSCEGVSVPNGNRLDRYELDKPDKRDEPDVPDEGAHPDEEHHCDRRMIAHKFLDAEDLSGLSTIARSFLPPAALVTRPSTALLMHCAGCGDYSVITVREHWTMADLDPAFPLS